MTHPAYQKLLDFNRQHPDSKEIYRQMQLWQLKNGAGDGLFYPSSYLYQIAPKMAIGAMLGHTQVSDYDKMSQDTKELLTHFWGLHLFGAWRNTLSIYQIDDDMIDSVLDSTIPPDTPASIFERLPEWAVYFDLSNAKTALNLTTAHSDPAKILGFWALYDRYPKSPAKALHLVPNLAGKTNSMYDHFQPLSLILDDGATVASQAMQAVQALRERGNSSDDLLIYANAQGDNKMLAKLLSCLLWLCADTPDISNIVGEPIAKEHLRLPRYTINKKTGAFVVPSAPIFYHIAKRLGGEIRTFNERIGQSDDRVSSRKRPHIRKGHWHGHWRGTGQAKEFFVKWQPAIFVNASI